MATTASDDPPRPPQDRLLTTPMLLLIGAGMAYFTVGGMLFPVLPRFVENELGGGKLQVGIVFGAYSLGAIVIRPVAGRLGDRFGRRTIMVGGALVFGLTYLLYEPAGAVGGWWLVAVIRWVSGLASAFVYVGQATAATELAPPERQGQALGTYSVAVFAGTTIGPPIGELVLKGAGFSATFLVATAIGVISGLLPLGVPETRPPGEPDRSRVPLIHPAARRIGAVNLLAMLAMPAFYAFMTPHAESLGVENVFPIFVVTSGAVFLARAVGTRLLDAVAPRRIGSISITGFAVACAIVAAVPAVPALYVAALAFSVGFAFYVPATMLVAVERAPATQRAAVVSSLTAFGDLANGAGAFVLGAVVELVGMRGMYGTVSAACVVAFVLFRSRWLGVSAVARKHVAR